MEEMETQMAFFGWAETLVIGGVLVLFFGAKKLPELASGLGKALKTFKKTVDSDSHSPEDDLTPLQSEADPKKTMDSIS